MGITVCSAHINQFEEGGSFFLQPPNSSYWDKRSSTTLDTQWLVLPSVLAKAVRPITQKVIKVWKQEIQIFRNPENVPAQTNMSKLCTHPQNLTSGNHFQRQFRKCHPMLGVPACTNVTTQSVYTLDQRQPFAAQSNE
jgi:hypothetical protein